MGFLIAMESETGSRRETLIDTHSALISALVERERERSEFPMLWQIEWEGDTTFNRLQIPQFRRELQQLTVTVTDARGRTFLETLDRFAEAALGGGLHLKFYGD